MAIRTIFSMAEDCARGERLGWMEFVRDFAGIARNLLAHFFPSLHSEPPHHAKTGPPPQRSKTSFVGDPGRDGDPVELDEHVVAVFQRAGADGSAWFRGLRFTNEREFMMAFRDLVFVHGREQERGKGSEVSLDQVRSVVRDLTLLEREMLWLVIKGYDAPQIAAIMMHAAATAEAVQRIASERLAAVVSGTAPEAVAHSARVLMELAEQSKTDECLALKTFNNLVNGQISWRERELAEEHMSNCFYCIDHFTTFQEMIRLRKDVPGLAPPEVEAILAQLPFVTAKPGGLLSRLFAAR